MFCENCGKQIPDASAFCEHCGASQTPVASPAAAVEPAAPVATAAPAKTPVTLASLMEKAKAIHKKNKLIFPIAGAVVVVAIVLAVVLGMLGKQVSLSNYLDVQISGYDGYSSIEYDFGGMSFGMRAAGDKDSKEYGYHEEDNFLFVNPLQVSKDYRKNLETAQRLVDSINVSYTLPEGKISSKLANGDVITFTIEYDEKLAKKLGLTIKDTTFEYTVKDLKPVSEFDILAQFTLEATGFDGYGEIKLVCSETASKTVGDYIFEAEAGKDYIRYMTKEGGSGTLYPYIDGSTYNKANNDVVPVKINLDSERFLAAGILLVGLEKDFTVTGLEAMQTVDILQYYDVTFTGLDGSGRAALTPKQETVTIGDFTFDTATYKWTYKGEHLSSTYMSLSKSYNLTNEDTITLSFSPSENTFASRGLTFSTTEKQLTVSGLAKYVTQLSEIKNADTQKEETKQLVTDFLNDNWGRAVHNSYFGSYSNQSIGDDMKLYKMLLTTPKSSTSSTKNTLWFVYSVTISDNKITTPTVYYFAVAQNNAAVYTDGTLYSTSSSYTKYTGLSSYDELYNNLVNQFNLNVEASAD